MHIFGQRLLDQEDSLNQQFSLRTELNAMVPNSGADRCIVRAIWYTITSGKKYGQIQGHSIQLRLGSVKRD